MEPSTACSRRPDLTHDTINGLVAFMIPGPDAYSVTQGVSTTAPGGIDGGATDAYIHALNLDSLFLPTLADMVAGLLNEVAVAVNAASTTGTFPSPFANLSFEEKAAVSSVLDGDPAFDSLRNLISIIPGLLVFIAFSEAAVWDRATRTLTGTPLGWTLSDLSGPAEGRDELRGYFRNRRGPQGPAGPVGLQGPQGVAGPGWSTGGGQVSGSLLLLIEGREPPPGYGRVGSFVEEASDPDGHGGQRRFRMTIVIWQKL